MVGGGLFRLPHDLFRSTLLYSIHFSSPVTILKTERFHYISVENRMQKYGQEGFFAELMWNPNIKAINITKLVEMIFNA